MSKRKQHHPEFKARVALDGEFCVDALNEVIHKFGPPEIMNTDQGSQFTSFAWTERLRRSGIRISIDGKGRFLPSHRFCETTAGQWINIVAERLRRSLKYECVYLHASQTGSEVKAGVRKWIALHNHKCPHSALGGKPPAVINWQRNETTNPDQQVQRVALITPDPVQGFGCSLQIGNSSKHMSSHEVMKLPYYMTLGTVENGWKEHGSNYMQAMLT